jgi:4-hydroxythreonine-4-phosphate dehydrogenase
MTNLAEQGRSRPTIALAMGDPAGISPELTIKLLGVDEIRSAARIVVVGDQRVFDQGAGVAGVAPPLQTIGPDDPVPTTDEPIFVDLGHLDPRTVERGVAAEAGGRFALANYSHALRMAARGEADAVCFTPFNKRAMRLAHPSYDDEISFSAGIVATAGPAGEFNVLDRLWNARVTSHVPLSEVASLITEERILRSLMLTESTMQAAGFDRPRIAVAGLNPHAGDGGNFGREEIDVIAPAVKAAKAQGIAAEGPFPSDTVFLRAKAGAFDAVLTMYHDQGQIAMKLMGFDRGVTLLGGFPFPICTPAHGTAYDIAGCGIANVGAAREALLLAIRMAERSTRAAVMQVATAATGASE